MQLHVLHPSFCKLNRAIMPEENLSPEAKLLKIKMQHCADLRKNKVPWEQIKNIVGISRSNYFRLQKKIKIFGIKGLVRRSKRPKKLRRSLIPDHYVKLVQQIRSTGEGYGKEKIGRIMRRDHGAVISDSSVGRILTKLMKLGKIRRSRSAWCTRRKRNFANHAKRWEYGKHKPTQPGQMVQIDHMSVVKNNVAFKHFQAWDPLSKYIDADVCCNATSRAAKTFLLKLVKDAPFKITSVQVDGGSEFMADFELACKDLGIALYVLPPKKPQYNGGVERGNRIFREEFYARDDLHAESVGAFKFALKSALVKYNSYRPHKSLDYLTPFEYLQLISRSQ